MKESLGIDMILRINKIDFEKYPSLDDLFLVEDELQNMNGSVITINQLRTRLKNKISDEKLQSLLEYLENINKIVFSSKGISWIYNLNSKLNKEIQKGQEL